MKSKKIIVVVLLTLSILFILFRIIKAFELSDISTSNSKYYYNEKFDREDSILFLKVQS